jgi:hypothetical protein
MPPKLPSLTLSVKAISKNRMVIDIDDGPPLYPHPSKPPLPLRTRRPWCPPSTLAMPVDSRIEPDKKNPNSGKLILNLGPFPPHATDSLPAAPVRKKRKKKPAR